MARNLQLHSPLLRLVQCQLTRTYPWSATTLLRRNISGTGHVPLTSVDQSTLTEANIRFQPLVLRPLMLEELEELGRKGPTTAFSDDLIKKFGSPFSLAKGKVILGKPRRNAKNVLAQSDALAQNISKLAALYSRDNTFITTFNPNFKVIGNQVMLPSSALISGKALFHCLEKRLVNRIVAASVAKVTTEEELNLAAKNGGIGPALCQATIAAWWWHERFGSKSIRGWVTSGVSWQFFISSVNPDGKGAVVSVLPKISLNSLSNASKEDKELAWVMGLLYDWAANPDGKELLYCDYGEDNMARLEHSF